MQLLAVYEHASPDTYRATVRRALAGAEKEQWGDFLVTDYDVGPAETDPLKVSIRALVDAHVVGGGEVGPPVVTAD